MLLGQDIVMILYEEEENIKYTIKTDIQEEQELKSIDMLSESLGRLQKAQIGKDTGNSAVFVVIGCNPQIQDVTCIQVLYDYNKNAKFFQRMLQSDKFVIEVIMKYEDATPNITTRRTYTTDFKIVENILYDFVEKHLIPDLIG